MKIFRMKKSFPVCTRFLKRFSLWRKTLHLTIIFDAYLYVYRCSIVVLFVPLQLLIGYKKGIIVLWNQDKIKAAGTFKASHDLESLFWHHSANQFISAHERGIGF